MIFGMKNSIIMRSIVSVHVLFSILFLGSLSFVTASCSDSNDSEDTQVVPDHKGFSFTVVPWGGDANGSTRGAASKAHNIGSVNVGNNISGFVSMDNEKPTAVTRAADGNTDAVADGDYTIVAYLKNSDGSYTKSRELAVVGKSGVFTKADGSEARFSFLPNGTYKFMCFNQYFTLSDDGNTLKLTSDADAAEKALVGYSDDVKVKDNTTDVAFALKHPYSRFKIRLAGTDMTLSSRKDVAHFDRVFSSTTEFSRINFDNRDGYAGNLTVTGGNMDVKPFSASSSSATPEDKGTFTFTAPLAKTSFDKEYGANVALAVPTYANSTYYQASEQAAYCYVPAGMSPTGITLNIAAPGTKVNGVEYKDSLYGEPLSGSDITIASNASLSSMQAGHSYIFTVNLSYNYRYVFSDYTVGTLADNPAKTPIALVTSSKTKTAMALHDAYYNGSAKMYWSTLTSAQQVNKNIYGWTDFFTVFNGWKETYLASYALDGTTVRASSNDYPAYYAAAHYNPDKPSSPAESISENISESDNTKTWYLPAYGDVNILYQSIGGGKYYGYTSGKTPITEYKGFNINNYFPWNGCRVVLALEQAGGDKLNIGGYWLSTQSDFHKSNQSSTIYYPAGLIMIYYNSKGASYDAVKTADQSIVASGSTFYVRPFIHY